MIHAFVRGKNGNFVSFDFLASTRMVAFGINSKGDIVGQYDDADFKTHGFLRPIKLQSETEPIGITESFGVGLRRPRPE
jgi:hypothetical protein